MSCSVAALLRCHHKPHLLSANTMPVRSQTRLLMSSIRRLFAHDDMTVIYTALEYKYFVYCITYRP